jgi:hypothetical protein
MAEAPDQIIPTSEEIPQTININGVEYDPTELDSFINKGKQTLELEKQWNTPVDKVWPAYGEATQNLKNTAAEKAALEEKIAKYESKESAGTDTPQDLKAAREAARQLGITLDEDLDKKGYVKLDQLDEYLTKRDQKQEAIKSVMAKAEALENEINGEDGRPAFNKKIVLAYATAYNIHDLKEAYEDMNKPQLDKWKSEQVNSQKAKGLKTLATGGAKTPEEKKITDDNFDASLRESLYGESQNIP